MSELYANAAKSGQEVTAGCTCNKNEIPALRDVKPALTPIDKRRAAKAREKARLLASLPLHRAHHFNVALAPAYSADKPAKVAGGAFRTI